MIVSESKPQNQELQDENIKLVEEQIDFTAEIANLASQVHNAYLEKTKEADYRIAAIQKIQTVLNEFQTDA